MPPPQRASVLIVDDETSIRESLRMVLEFEGYRIEEAGNGLEALRIVRDRPPDAILLDIRMPEMDGLETLKTLRERGYEMPVLVISGHGDVATAVEATRRGAYFTSHHNWFMSCAHTQDDLERTLAIAEDAFAALETSPEGQGVS